MKRLFGWVDGNFISDIGSYSTFNNVEGVCQFEWRQGVKHDCSKVMELTTNQNDGKLYNGLKEIIDVEKDRVYPLLKSSDLKENIITKTRKSVIITQKKVKEDTTNLTIQYPKLWNYLENHSILLDGRKSSIYKNSPRFSIFGIGDYSFKPYKVAVSGFYKEPVFALVYGDKPIMLDDTCYFIGFNDYKPALITMLLLNSKIAQDFLKSIAFLDSKRPYTKEVLMRIDLSKLVDYISFNDIIKIAKGKGICQINKNDYSDYINNIKANN